MNERDRIAIGQLDIAYRALLCVPHACATRDRIQTALAILRDELALLHKVAPQEVQDTYEQMIAQLSVRQLQFCDVAGHA